MRPEFDKQDAELLARREILFNQVTGPRVGDFLRVEGGFLRFTHDWGEDIQTTVHAKHPCHGDASFYLSDGYVSFSGSLDPAIDKSKLRDTGETVEGSFWFFHHNQACAENGVYFQMRCKVWEVLTPVDKWLAEQQAKEIPPLHPVDRVIAIVDRGLAGEDDMERDRR